MKKPATPFPTTPGELLVEEYLIPLGLTQTELANKLGVSFRTINEICNNRRVLTARMALLLAGYFKTTPEFWMNAQMACDLWDAWEKLQKKKKAS